MKLPRDAYTSRPWRIHEVTEDFRLEDVWELPGRGGPGDFVRLVEMIASTDPARSSSGAIRGLFALRWKLGEIFGLDDPRLAPGSGLPSLRERMPADLLAAPDGPDFPALPLRPLYLLDDEFAAEIANRTMHGVLHLGAVADGSGGFRPQMAVLVRPNGLLGNAYMAAIKPARRSVVYPVMMREGERRWRAQGGADYAGGR